VRLFVIGQAAFGEQALARLLEKGHQVIGVSAPPHPAGGRPEPLRALAEKHSLPVITTRDLKRKESFDAYAALRPELNVMVFVTDILPVNVLEHPPLKTIQYHPSLLPRHRGASAMNWPIIQGESKTGLSIFWPDRGIDTGPLLLQREVEITADETLGSLYFNKLFPMGVDAIEESVRLVAERRAPRTVQDETGATYEPICTPEHAQIDWSKPAHAVYNLIRGCNPQPGSHTTFRGQRLSIFDSRLLGSRPGTHPGQVLGVEGNDLLVGLHGGLLAIQRVQRPGAAKVKAPDFAVAEGVKLGEMFGGLA